MEREKLAGYYQKRFEFFKKQFPSFNHPAVESFLNLLRTGDILRATVERRMRKYDLTGPAFGILTLLESAPEKQLPMNAIGEQLVVTQANVTGLVDTLEKKKLVERKHDPNDRRVRYIRITNAGSKKLKKILPEHLRFIESLFRTFARKEKNSLIQSLERVRAQLLKSVFLLLPLYFLHAIIVSAQERFTPLLSNSTASASEFLETNGALSLMDCYSLALKQTETLQIQTEKIRQAEERYKQARGGVFPRLDFNLSDFFQDTSGSGGAGSAVGATLTRGERQEAKFTLQQPIFSGFREFAAMSAFKAQRQKENLTLQRDAKVLFQEVGRAFYLVMQLETELDNLQTLLNLTQERIRELQAREKLGKARPSEILSVESQLATLKSEEEQFKEQLARAREILSFLIGKEAEAIRLKDNQPKIDTVEPEEVLLKKAASRSDLKALQEDLESKRQSLKIAQGALWPTINLVGNYYTKRVGFQELIDWDILLTMSIPLFQAGSQTAKVREAASQLLESQLALARLARNIRTEIKSAYLALKSSAQQSKTLEQATKKAEQSYKLQVQEYRLGLVNNLEVLQAMNAMQDAKRKFDSTVIQGKLKLLELQVATEELP